MSDTLLVSVENLINIAMGPPEKNILNYKMLQTVLHVLARHMRILETKVEIKNFDEEQISSSPSSASIPSSACETEGRSAKSEKARLKKERGAMERKKRRKEGKGKEEKETKKEGRPKYDKHKAEKAAAKEKKKMAKMSPKAKEKYLKEKEKEERALDKMTREEKEQYFIEKEKLEEERLLLRKKGQAASGGVAVTAPRRIGSIEVVTQSEFRKLEDVVMELQERARPLPMPTLPGSKKLRSDLVTGRASLADTMEAMQVSARVQAAEQAIDRMAGMLTQLALAGALPVELAKQLEDVKTEMIAAQAEAARLGRPSLKSVAIDPMSEKQPRLPTAGPQLSRDSAASRGSVSAPVYVTRDQMDDDMQSLQEDLMTTIQSMTQQAVSTAERASSSVNELAKHINSAMDLKHRIDTLYSHTSDYAAQLSGFDAGLATTMQGFKEQMMQMKEDMKGGLLQLESVNNNLGSSAIMELTERYDMLSMDLEVALANFKHLYISQRQLGNELQSLIDAVEGLEEQKADRDELLDRLRDKADISQLHGLVTMQKFDFSKADLERKLAACYAKFASQESVWTLALKDLSNLKDGKVEITQMLKVKHEAQETLQSIQETLKMLAIQLGEPKAAILLRLLSRDGQCASCKKSALMDPTDAEYGQPPALPSSLRPVPEREPCVPQSFPRTDISMKSMKEHICKRWAGGSHTLLRSDTPRETVAPLAPLVPSRRYTDYGSNGKLYNMAEELLPCIECNKEPVVKRRHPMYDIPKEYRVGAGDDKLTTKLREPFCDCLPTI